MDIRKIALISTFISIGLASCSSSSPDDYKQVSPVVMDLALVPYQKLSDYKFFEGDLKNLTPAYGVLPFEPSSALFSDYAHKKRFVWMPEGVKATYVSPSQVLDLPVGAVLIKSFYYENVQNLPSVNGTRILETRLMIHKQTGWSYANYVWNDDQTEAYFDLAGSDVDISFLTDNGELKETAYRIPEESQCLVCHKQKVIENGTEVAKQIPIGIKPQNLNWIYPYDGGAKNQLAKWVEMGYLDSNFTMPTASQTVIDYTDASKPIGDRARAYVDSNCSHCHSDDRHCDYRPMRFAWKDSEVPAHMGVCVATQDMQGFPEALNNIVTPGNIGRSMLYYRINTTNEAYRMPLHGRTIIHEEGVAMMAEWINSLPPCN
jgi:uncharacterized repeat protein (TIGR03806 family)